MRKMERKSPLPFTGFTDAVSEFFIQIRMNNNSVFFQEHRQEYEAHVKAPFYAFAQALAPSVLLIDPNLEVRPGKVVSRIRRDTRFTKDKSPYRDHMWISWRPVRGPEGERSAPELYFTVNAARWEIGAGYYAAPPAAMKALRGKMLASPNTLLTLIGQPGFADVFALGGDEYRRPPEGMDMLPEALRPWYIKKGIFLSHSEPLNDAARTPAFAGRMADLLQAVAPVYHYLCQAK